MLDPFDDPNGCGGAIASPEAAPAAAGFPNDGSETGRLIRAIDWAATPLGPIDQWSPILRAAVTLILPSRAQIVMFWGPEFVALYNDAYAPTIGYKHPRALGRPARENWAELWDDLEPLLQRARAGETVVAADRPFVIERNGFLESVWFDISYSPARGEDGTVEGVVCVVSETTERVLAVQRLAHLAATLEQQVAERTRERDRAWNNAQDLLAVIGDDGVIRAANPAWQTVLGRRADTVVGRRLVDLIHRADRAALHGHRARLDAGERLAWESRCLHRDGSFRWIGWRASSEAGLIYATGRDITRQREQAAALERSETYLRSIFETSYQYQGLLTPDGMLLDANPTSLAGIGARRDDVLGRPFWETPWFSGTPGMADEIAATIPRVVAGESIRREMVLDLPIGRRVLDFSLRPMHDSAGRIIALVPEAVDVTERRAAEDQLRQAQKMEAVGQLTGGIAHDFNNLLTGIIGSIDILRRRIAAGRTDDLDRFFEAAVGSAHRAAALTHRLLAFSRRQSLDLRPIDVDALIAGMGDLLHRTLGEQIRLQVVRHDGTWPAQGDPNQTESALLNFAINARDAMPDGGTLTITAANVTLDETAALRIGTTPGDYVVLRVIDTGIGMEKDVLERVFDPFFTTKPIGQGTGLGLSMAYGYAKQARGHLQVDSEVGRGTTVTLYLPRADAPAVPAAPIETSAAPADGEAVLVIEDDAAVRQTVVEVLRELGYEALEAMDGRGALVILDSSRRIDLLITDVGLPGLNGRQVAEMARQRRPGLKVLFITGYAGEAAARGDFLAPGMELITKPFAVPALAARIRAIIERPAAGPAEA
ncbi:MAG: PAS domain-containing protein [Rhodovulum sp.]|nr:PAS domain-containing protein [Rhodovulum sp.]